MWSNALNVIYYIPAARAASAELLNASNRAENPLALIKNTFAEISKEAL
jgi:hypothetical protein